MKKIPTSYLSLIVLSLIFVVLVVGMVRLYRAAVSTFIETENIILSIPVPVSIEQHIRLVAAQ